MSKSAMYRIHMQQRTETETGYFKGDATCECGLATGNTAHMMQCTLLALPCSMDDLNSFNDIAKKCVEGNNFFLKL